MGYVVTGPPDSKRDSQSGGYAVCYPACNFAYYILRELCVTLVFLLLHKYYRYYIYSHSSARYADASGNQGREDVTVVDSRDMEITQPWYLALLNLLVVHPWYSWGLKTLLTDPFSNPHPTCGSRPATTSCLEIIRNFRRKPGKGTNTIYRIAGNVGRRKLWQIWRFAWIRQSFIHQLILISEKAIEAGFKFAKVFFAKCNSACNSPKFCPAKIFRYTVHNRVHGSNVIAGVINKLIQFCALFSLPWAPDKPVSERKGCITAQSK